MKVYVMTKAELFKSEVYVGVKKTRKEAEKALRFEYPHMKSNDNGRSYVADASNSLLLFIHEEDIG